MALGLCSVSADTRCHFSRHSQFIGLRERPEDSDFIAENFAWRPRDTGCIIIHAIDHKLPTATDIVDSVLKNLYASCGFNNNIKSMWVLLLDFLKLRCCEG